MNIYRKGEKRRGTHVARVRRTVGNPVLEFQWVPKFVRHTIDFPKRNLCARCFHSYHGLGTV